MAEQLLGLAPTALKTALAAGELIEVNCDEKVMRKLHYLLASLLLTVVSNFAGAQTYPSKPIRLIVPYPPGGTGDLVARSYTQELSERLGQQVIVDFRAGANGSIGTAEVARAAPDGYTLLQVFDTFAVNHHLFKVQYDFDKSFAPISLLVQSPGVIVAPANFPPSTIAELIEYAKANPEKVTSGNSGSASPSHFAAVRFSKISGISLTHVPYKGGAPLLNDLLGGHVNIAFGTLPLFAPYVRSGKLKVIALLSKTRSRQFPDVPAVAETIAGFEANDWFGLVAPAGTPENVLHRIHQELMKTLADGKVIGKFESLGFDVVVSSPGGFATFLNHESDVAEHLIREEGIKAD